MQSNFLNYYIACIWFTLCIHLFESHVLFIIFDELNEILTLKYL